MANIDEVLGSLDEQNKEEQQQNEQLAARENVRQSSEGVKQAVQSGTKQTVDALKDVKGEVKVTNPDLAKSQDVAGAVEAINKLNLTTFMQNEGLPQLAENLSNLSTKTQELQTSFANEGLNKLSDQLSSVVKKLDAVSKLLSKTEVTVDAKLQKTVDNLSKSINAIDFKPSVNVSAPEPKVVTSPVDLKPILKALDGVKQAITDSEIPEAEIDMGPVINGLQDIKDTLANLRFPAANYVLPFRNSQGKATQIQLNDDGSLPISDSTSSGTATIVSGQQTATTAAVALASNSVSKGVVLEALTTNAVSVFVGPSSLTTSNGLELSPGSAVTLPVNNTNAVYIRCASSSPVVSFVGI